MRCILKLSTIGTNQTNERIEVQTAFYEITHGEIKSPSKISMHMIEGVHIHVSKAAHPLIFDFATHSQLRTQEFIDTF